MASWPATVPVTRNSYSESSMDRTVRSKMETGPDKIRRRSSALIRQVAFSLFLTDDQLEDLDQFYLDNDAAVFDFTDPRTGVAMRARFTERPSYTLNQTMWAVGVKLEYLPL